MSWSISSPATRSDRDSTMPPIEKTATSVVPPPMSMIIDPSGSPTGRPAPKAAAMGSSMRKASRAPAAIVASYTARFSTSVTPEGTPTTTRGLGIGTMLCSWALPMKYSNMASVISNSEITPSRRGRMAVMLAGVRPAISFASAPIATGRLVFLSIATQDGSLITIPLLRTLTRVLAVPRSMPISRENRPKNHLVIGLLMSGLNAKDLSPN